MIPDQIILATDFSPASTAAHSVAGKMAKLFNCKILIVHVFQYVACHRYAMPVGWMIEIIRSDVQRKILETQHVFTTMGLDTKALLIEDGFPTVEILNVAQTYKAPMIVMGTHAVAGMDRFLLGSTAEGVLRGATCPVITVGPHVHPAGTANAVRRLLFATDFNKESLDAVPFVATLRDAAASSLEVLYVETNIDAVQSPLFHSLRAELDVPDMTRHHPATEYLTLHGAAIAQAITNEAERLAADLLILGVKRASAFAAHLTPKIAFQVIAAAPCAVLTISS